jgi:hypothetical protein
MKKKYFIVVSAREFERGVNSRKKEIKREEKVDNP